jgi:Mn-containing catalase
LRWLFAVYFGVLFGRSCRAVFRHDKRLQFPVQVDRPDPVLARRVQEVIGGQYGEISVMMQYLFQGWNCRHPGKYKDLIMATGTEEIGHVEMLATLVSRLLEGAPLETRQTAMDGEAAVAAIIGGMDPQHAIVTGLGATPRDSNGTRHHAPEPMARRDRGAQGRRARG